MIASLNILVFSSRRLEMNTDWTNLEENRGNTPSDK